MNDFYVSESNAMATPVNEPKETVKAIIENMDCILNELENVIRMINDGVNGANPQVVKEPYMIKENKDMPIANRLRMQRDFAEGILHTAMNIKEGLW